MRRGVHYNYVTSYTMDYLFLMGQLVVVTMCVMITVFSSHLPDTLTYSPCISLCYCDTDLHIVSCYEISIAQGIHTFVAEVPADTQNLFIDQSMFNVSFIAVHNITRTIEMVNMETLSFTHSKVLLLDLYDIELPNLLALYISHNYIQDLSPFMQLSLNFPQLEILDLNNNYVRNIDDSIFLNTNHLTSLDLSNNNISEVHVLAFQYLNSLTSLNLESNHLSYLHPAMFNNITQLISLKLADNQLTHLHEDVMDNLLSLEQITLYDNMWDCNCGMEWLREKMISSGENHSTLFTHVDRVKCVYPLQLSGVVVFRVSFGDMTCVNPVIKTTMMDHYIQRMFTIRLYCNVSGTPSPSVYWLTPHGITAHILHRQWMDSSITSYHTHHSYHGMPTYIETDLIPQSDGSLLIKQMRNYFNGEYTCVAENPAGVVHSSFNVTVVSPIRYYISLSLIVGGFSAVGFLFFGILVGSVRMLYETMCSHMNNVKEPLSEDMLCHYDYDTGGYLFQYIPRDYCVNDLDQFSPVKCPTPAEQCDAESHMADLAANIRYTLEDVRTRLWIGMGRRVDSIRTHAHHIRTSSSQYMSTIRESSSTYIHHMRSSSTEYSKRMKVNMVMGVESVKYHVQSMKDYCGTGSDMMHTVSAVSVTTDVDTSKSTTICKRTTVV